MTGQAELEKVSATMKLAAGCALVLLTLLAYGNILTGEFISYDDPLYILERPQVWDGLTFDAVRWALTNTSDMNWIPVTWLSYLLDVTLFGVNASGHHAVNLLIHLVSSLLLLVLLQRMTGSFWRSSVVAALFALHPLHVESVAWIAERKDVLSGLFFMLTLLAYHRYAVRPSPGRYLTTLLLYLLGLGAKSMLVTMPFLLLLLDYWPLERWSPGTTGEEPAPDPAHQRERGRVPAGRLVAEKVPFLLVAALAGIMTLVVQQQGGAVADYADSSLGENLASAVVGYAAYLAKAIVPVDLAVFYPFDYHIPFWKSGAAALFLVAVTLLVLRFGRRCRYLPVCWFWFVVMLLPVSGIIPVGSQSIADRYTYLPLIGPFILAVWGLADLARNRALLLRLQAGVWIMAIGTLCAVTWVQVSYWHDNTTLFSHAIEVTENNWLAYQYLGSFAMMRGDLVKALEYTRESIRINPANADAHANLGLIHRNLRNDAEAVRCFTDAVRLEPRNSAAHLELGKNHLFSGNIDGALAEYRLLQTIDPDRAAMLMTLISQSGGMTGVEGK